MDEDNGKDWTEDKGLTKGVGCFAAFVGILWFLAMVFSTVWLATTAFIMAGGLG